MIDFKIKDDQITIEAVKNFVEGIPFMSFKQAETMHNFITDHEIQNILEL